MNSSNLNTTGSSEYHFMDTVVETIAYCVIVFGCVGTLGSILTLRLFVPVARKRSIYLMFVVMALCDGTVIVGYMAETVSHAVFEISLLQLTGCHVLHLLIYVSGEMSSWILVLISTERIIVCFFPHRGPAHFTPRLVALYLMCIAVCLFGVNFPFFGGLRPLEQYQLKKCEGKTDYIEYYYVSIYPKLETVCYSLIPSVLLLVQNVLLIQKMRQLQSQVSPAVIPQNTSTTHELAASNHIRAQQQQPQQQPRQHPPQHQHPQQLQPPSLQQEPQQQRKGLPKQQSPKLQHHPQQQQQPQHHQQQHRLHRKQQQQQLSPSSCNTSKNTLAVPSTSRRRKRRVTPNIGPEDMQPPIPGSPVNGATVQQMSAQKSMVRLIKITLLLSLSFITLTVPCSVIAFLDYLVAWDDDQRSLGISLGFLLAFTNHCINCMLYCLSGRKYRRQMFKLIGCKK